MSDEPEYAGRYTTPAWASLRRYAMRRDDGGFYVSPGEWHVDRAKAAVHTLGEWQPLWLGMDDYTRRSHDFEFVDAD